MFARKPGKGITLEMYIRNTQVNKKKKDIVPYYNIPVSYSKLPSPVTRSIPTLLN